MRIRKFVCAAVLAAFIGVSVSGCYGSYALFNAVHKWNGSIGNKWINSVVHLVFWIVPVYGICTFADFLIFNTIEFWTGSSVVAKGDTYQESDTDGNKVYAVRNTDGTLSVNMTDAQGNKADFTLERDGNAINFIDANGKTVARQIVDKDGEIVAQVAVK
jgi:hypothetical protein